VVHKADGEQLAAAQRACGDYAAAQRLLHGGRDDGWLPPVLSVSSLTGVGLEAVWHEIESHRAALGDDGIAAKRRQQALEWFDQAVADGLRARFLADPAVAAKLPRLRQQVLDGSLQPTAAARALL